MNFCKVCGKELADGATFCPACGAQVVSVQTPTTQAPVQQFVPQQNPTQSAPQQYPEQPAQPQYPTQQAQPQYPVQQQYPMQQAQPIYQYPMQPAPVSKAAKILGNISFALGLISIIFCWLCFVPISGFALGIYCLMFAIAGIVLASISKKKGTVKKATTGKVLSIIALIVTIIGMIFSIFSMVAIAEGDYDSYDYEYNDYDYDYDYDDDWLDYTNA